jgi:hypothetical protein
MEQGLIYDPTALKRIDEFLNTQEEEFQNIDKSEEAQNKRFIRIGILVGVSAILILGLKVLIKRNK